MKDENQQSKINGQDSEETPKTTSQELADAMQDVAKSWFEWMGVRDDE